MPTPQPPSPPWLCQIAGSYTIPPFLRSLIATILTLGSRLDYPEVSVYEFTPEDRPFTPQRARPTSPPDP
ncbi:hypothetical protein COMA1_11553 [Candidatus Nitrospira nitrosa]|uniref:Uncharacterized protein n=1 Tax=Candidatus Nitrospira nitrosa TaxID=1742972 RepID=A0A0S4L8Y7_9BACT|nr:hypothetical protein COMA1_11553 [Candidatus Nitrospira nitrosa]